LGIRVKDLDVDRREILVRSGKGDKDRRVPLPATILPALRVHLKRVREQLKAQGMALEVTQAAKDHLIKLGWDPAFGARPLRRTIQNLIEDVLAEHLLLNRYPIGTTIVVDGNPDGGLLIQAAEQKTPVEVS